MAGSREVITIDCNYLEPEFAAAYLLVDRSQTEPVAAFIDNNTAHAVPQQLAELARQGLTPAHVRYVIITHVHLDHAGGTSALMQACPNATLLAHPRAMPHMIDPSKLVASARKVYGDQEFERLYGTIQPVPAERTRIIEDGERVRLGAGELRFFFTRGHANHHFCVYDESLAVVFTGDAFGLRYPALQKEGKLFVLPSTSPTDFDEAEAVASVDRIVATGARAAYPTHFGAVPEVREAGEQLKEHLRASGAILAEAIELPLSGEALAEELTRRVRAYYERYLQQRGIAFSAHDWRLLELDLKLNGAGLAFVAEKKRKARA